jgi:uncharacterized damage-inducible protein DinB
MTAHPLLSDLYGHMEWADAEVWRAVLGSDAARADVRTLGLLQHIHLVQRAFLSIWRGAPIDAHAGEGLDAAALQSWAREYYREAVAEIAATSEETMSSPARVPWTRQIAESLGFDPSPVTVSETMLQAALHSLHHRAQVVARLREIGAAPPLVDYIAWLWRGRPTAKWD